MRLRLRRVDPDNPSSIRSLARLARNLNNKPAARNNHTAQPGAEPTLNRFALKPLALGSGRLLGSVFAVTRRLALTALHCVSDRNATSTEELQCIWSSGSNDASVIGRDEPNDVALLRLERSLSRELDPVPLSTDVTSHERFAAPGALGELLELPLVAMSGEIIWPEGLLTGGVPGIQLVCTESVAGLSLHGLSGAPVLTGKPQKAVGMIRWNPPRADDPDLATGAIVYATPVARILQCWPKIYEDVGLTDVVRRLTDRSHARAMTEVNADIRTLFVSGDLGLDEDDLSVMPTAKDEHRWIVVDAGQLIIRIVRNFDTSAVVEVAEQELSDAVGAQTHKAKQRYAAVLTDGIQWRLYQRPNDELRLIDVEIANPRASEDLLGWLEAIMGTSKNIPPGRYEIQYKLGAAVSIRKSCERVRVCAGRRDPTHR